MTLFAQNEAQIAAPMDEAVRSVLIVGGGSSGWMAAAALATALGSAPSGRVKITLVESDKIATVGVGEATIPPIQKFNRFLKLDERQFLKDTHGTFKLGIEFQNWARQGDRYLHQFGAVGREMDALVKLHHWWLMGRLADTGAQGASDYPQWQEMFVSHAAAKANRFAHPGQKKRELHNRYTYAYHFDALLYAQHLRGLAEARGVIRREGRIISVSRNGESGNIDSVALDNGESLEADLFIDCSGFRSLLLGEAMAEEWEDWSHWIPSDRAIAIATERPAGPLAPYTQGIAHSVGWQWRIPLQHRTGNGHVYSSGFSSDDEAEKRLFGALDGRPIGEPRLIKFATGRRRNSWTGNVVGLGLSTGFLEPLESTSLHFVQSAIERLIDHFPSRHMDAPLRDRFNHLSRGEWEGVRDFIIAHYHLSERDDCEFWRYTRAMDIPDSLKDVLALWKARGVLGVDGGQLFQLGSWSSMLIGQRFLPQGVHALANRADPQFAAQHIRAIAKDVRAAGERLPDHGEYLGKYCES